MRTRRPKPHSSERWRSAGEDEEAEATLKRIGGRRLRMRRPRPHSRELEVGMRGGRGHTRSDWGSPTYTSKPGGMTSFVTLRCLVPAALSFKRSSADWRVFSLNSVLCPSRLSSVSKKATNAGVWNMTEMYLIQFGCDEYWWNACPFLLPKLVAPGGTVSSLWALIRMP